MDYYFFEKLAPKECSSTINIDDIEPNEDWDEDDYLNEYDNDIDIPKASSEDEEIQKEIKGLHTLDFELSFEQLQAVTSIIKFINSRDGENEMLLIGGAGTGKSACISQVIGYLENHSYDYLACAPTHKARLSLEKLTKTQTLTLHQLLQLRPNIEVQLLNLRELEFQCGLTNRRKNDKYIHIPRLIIIDECSMITSDLYEFIQKELIIKRGVKLLYIGDSAQLKGVNDETISKVFEIDNKIELTKIYRQQDEAPLLYILKDLRSKPLYEFKDFESNYGSLYTTKDAKEFVVNACREYKNAIANEDPYQIKILTYTNKRIDAYNELLHGIIYKKPTTDYCIGEFVTGYDNYSEGGIKKIYNSLDYIVTDVQRHTKEPSDIFPLPLDGYILTLKDMIYGNTESDSAFGYNKIFVISKKIDSSILQSFINLFESTRIRAVNTPKKTSLYGELWAQYYALQEYFASPFDLFYDGRLIKSATIKLGYAISTHKSQGSSINNVYIDFTDLKKCYNKEEFRQLEYVALSRARNNIYLLK